MFGFFYWKLSIGMEDECQLWFQAGCCLGIPHRQKPESAQFMPSPRAFPCWNCGLCLFCYVPCEVFQMTVCPLCLAFCETTHFPICRAPLVVLKMGYGFKNVPSSLLTCIYNVPSESLLTTINYSHLVLGMLEDASCQWADLRKGHELVSDPLDNAGFSAIEENTTYNIIFILRHKYAHSYK